MSDSKKRFNIKVSYLLLEDPKCGSNLGCVTPFVSVDCSTEATAIQPQNVAHATVDFVALLFIPFSHFGLMFPWIEQSQVKLGMH